MKTFDEIKNKFTNIQNEFNSNVKDNVGSSINNNSLQPIAYSINYLSQVEKKIEIENIQIDRLMMEAKSILPKV